MSRNVQAIQATVKQFDYSKTCNQTLPIISQKVIF